MKIHVGDPDARRNVLEVLLAMPVSDRAVALKCPVLGVGRSANGMTLGRTVVIFEGAPAVTFAHEEAHVILGHHVPSADAERAAAALARSWGLAGPGADPERCADLFDRAEGSRAALVSTMVARVEDGELAIRCGQCGDDCNVYAPYVPGMPAEVGVECLGCKWGPELVALTSLREFCCPDCRTLAATSLVRDTLPALIAWECAGVKGLLAWIAHGAPELFPWIARGCHRPFSATWDREGNVRVRCGSCGAVTALEIARRLEVVVPPFEVVGSPSGLVLRPRVRSAGRAPAGWAPESTSIQPAAALRS